VSAVLRRVAPRFRRLGTQPGRRGVGSLTPGAPLVFGAELLADGVSVATLVGCGMRRFAPAARAARFCGRLYLARGGLLLNEVVIVLDHGLLAGIDPGLLRLHQTWQRDQRSGQSQREQAQVHDAVLP